MENDTKEAEFFKRKEAFYKAFNKCQGTMGAAKTDSLNPHFHNKYASLESVMAAISPFIEAGFSFSHVAFTLGDKTVLRTKMVYGGYEEYSDWPLVNDGNPQHTGSSASYARRYALAGLTGLVVDSDDDGNAASVKPAYKSEPVSFAKPDFKGPAAAVFTPKPEGSQIQEIGVARFVPSRVEMVPGKGKGAGKMFCEIYDGDTRYSGNEMQGQMAESARAQGKKIGVAFEQNGKFNNIKREGVKFLENMAPVQEKELEDSIPF